MALAVVARAREDERIGVDLRRGRGKRTEKDPAALVVKRPSGIRRSRDQGL